LVVVEVIQVLTQVVEVVVALLVVVALEVMYVVATEETVVMVQLQTSQDLQ
jgi:hypothetical protein